MQQYFDYNYNGPAFELFGTGHLVSLAIVAAASANTSPWSDTILRNTRKSGRPE